jgi:ankyrin repeat protein
VVKFLIANSANLDARDNQDGRNALHLASERGHKSVVEFLLSQGIDVNSRDGGGATPLLLAAGKGYKAVAQVLIDNKADVNAYGHLRRKEVSGTSLYYSIINSDFDFTKLLLAYKADPNATNSFGKTPIFDAIYTSMFNDKAVAIVELLLQNKADISIKCEVPTMGINGTPLSLAVWTSTKATELLISHGADVNATNGFGDTPLHIAVARYGKQSEEGAVITKNAIELLLAHGASINTQNSKGETPLHSAVRSNQISLVELLLKHKADVNIANRDGKTPLQLAKEFMVNPPPPGAPPQPTQQKGNPKMEELLHKYGATDTPKKAE